jgi:hypothetical protein
MRKAGMTWAEIAEATGKSANEIRLSIINLIHKESYETR